MRTILTTALLAILIGCTSGHGPGYELTISFNGAPAVPLELPAEFDVGDQGIALAAVTKPSGFPDRVASELWIGVTGCGDGIQYILLPDGEGFSDFTCGDGLTIHIEGQ